jgi:hypothetical protein
MFAEITYMEIFGKPLIMYLGMLVLLCMLATATIAILTMKGIRKWPVDWHIWGARITIALAFVHAFLGVSAFF